MELLKNQMINFTVEKREGLEKQNLFVYLQNKKMLNIFLCIHIPLYLKNNKNTTLNLILIAFIILLFIQNS